MDTDPGLLDLLARLVACDTTSGTPTAPVMALLASALEDRGCRMIAQDVEIRGVRHQNLVAALGPPATGGLLLSGHVDTVPHAGQPGWTRDPLRLDLADGRAFGRGVADMKGFVAQCVVALDRLRGAALARPLVLAFTAEEEVGCQGSVALARDLEALLAGPLGAVPLPRLAWIGEPTGWARHPAHKGIVQLVVRVRGRGGHSSLPDRGVNAIQVAARAVEAVGLLQEELRAPRAAWEALFPGAACTTLNVGTIRGGTAANVIPEACAFEISYRPLPDEPPLAVHDRIVALLRGLDLADHAGGDGRAAIDVDPEPLVVPGLDCSRDHALLDALAAELGPGPLRGAPYATDGGRLAALGMDVVICGPGELAQAHQPDESLALADLHRGPDVIAAVARRLLTGAV